jgi:Ni/Co efflux regulator RcnB
VSERHRLVTLVIALAVLAATLAGCAEGTSRDAEQGKARDAQRTSVVSDMQATHSARVLLPGTPPLPTQTPET